MTVSFANGAWRTFQAVGSRLEDGLQLHIHSTFELSMRKNEAYELCSKYWVGSSIESMLTTHMSAGKDFEIVLLKLRTLSR